MTLGKDDVDRLLLELATRLNDVGVEVTIHVVGGAAVMLTARPDRTATADVDSWINCGADDEVRAAVITTAVEIAQATPGLSETWLNEAARLYIPERVTGRLDDWRPHIEVGGVRIVLAKAEVLLVMKLRAGRGARDLPDADALMRACGLSSASQAKALFEAYYEDEEIRPLAWAWLQESYGE